MKHQGNHDTHARTMRYTGESAGHIREIFAQKTGVDPYPEQLRRRVRMRRAKRFAAAVPAAALVCAFAAFGIAKFSTLRGDELRLAATYEGNGLIRLELQNDSERELAIEQIRLMRWATAEEVPGDGEGLLWESEPVEAGGEAVRYVDLSQAYDVTALEEGLPDGDHFYLELTNNGFAEGQNWMVAVDFSEERRTDAVVYAAAREDPRAAEQEEAFSEDGALICLRDPDWVFPTEQHILSAAYGQSANGVFSYHVNFAGNLGDAVYAVADGTVAETGYDSKLGSYVRLRLAGSDTEPWTERIAEYGHLAEIGVYEGQEVSAGDALGTLGRTGLATGPNLYFAIYEDGEAVDPIAE